MNIINTVVATYIGSPTFYFVVINTKRYYAKYLSCEELYI